MAPGPSASRLAPRGLWPWLPLWLALALAATFMHGPLPFHSTRTLAVAWEMWDQGQWLVPQLNGAPYSHKVPLLFWLIHAGWAVGGVSDVWPRLLQVGLGAAQLLLAWRLARRLAPQRPEVARTAAWLLAGFSYAFLFGLQIMYEPLLGVCVLAALLALAPGPGERAPQLGRFGLWIGLGLLAKGPVMLLHLLFPWLLGPLWSAAARGDRRRWYGGGALALAGGLALFAVWLLPALAAGGADYAAELLWRQTSGRVVTAFDHARPVWWYLPMLLVLAFPLVLWPRAVLALARLRRGLEPAERFALCWLLPAFAAFSLVSGKQLYYLVPELPGLALLAALALARLERERPALAGRRLLRPWPAALVVLGAGAVLLLLPRLVAGGRVSGIWWASLAQANPWFALAAAGLALLLVRGSAHAARRLALAGLLGAFCVQALVTQALWPLYDLAPAARLVAAAQAAGRPVAQLGGEYAGQYHFLGRLHAPLAQLHEDSFGPWAARHPGGLVLVQSTALAPAALARAEQVQPLRSRWLVAWRAGELAAVRAGQPAAPDQAPARREPASWWARHGGEYPGADASR